MRPPLAVSLPLVAALGCTVSRSDFAVTTARVEAFIAAPASERTVGQTMGLEFAAFRDPPNKCSERCLDDPALDLVPATVIDARCEPACVVTEIGTHWMRPDLGVVTVLGTYSGPSELTLLLDVGDGRQELARRQLEFKAPLDTSIAATAGGAIAMVEGALDGAQPHVRDHEGDRQIVEPESSAVRLTVEGGALSVYPAHSHWQIVAERPGTASLVVDVGGTIGRRTIRVLPRTEISRIEVQRWRYDVNPPAPAAGPVDEISLGTSPQDGAELWVLGMTPDGAAALLPPTLTCALEPPELGQVHVAGGRFGDHRVAVSASRAGSGALRCALGDLVATVPVVAKSE